jgi:hypothetical protein
MKRSIGPIAMALGALALAGCASVPAPREQVAVSNAAVNEALTAGGGQYAPRVLQNAQRKLDAARAAMAAGDNVKARRLAEEAEVDARLAAADARSTMSQQAAAQVNASIDALRAEVERSTTANPGPAVVTPLPPQEPVLPAPMAAPTVVPAPGATPLPAPAPTWAPAPPSPAGG